MQPCSSPPILPQNVTWRWLICSSKGAGRYGKGLTLLFSQHYGSSTDVSYSKLSLENKSFLANRPLSNWYGIKKSKIFWMWKYHEEKCSEYLIFLPFASSLFPCLFTSLDAKCCCETLQHLLFSTVNSINSCQCIPPYFLLVILICEMP